MDPLSQGVLGAATALVFSKAKHTRQAAIIGGIAGMLADADILIRSATDPLLALEYHRHFTHSLSFIPIGGLITTLLFYFFYRKIIPFKMIYWYATLGYATHGLLDACTTYGTQLLWPFSQARVSWNNIAIVDPVFTLLLAFGIGFTIIKKDIKWSRIFLGLSLFYLLFGVFQRERASYVQHDIASQREHQIIRSVVHPTFGNLWLWRSIYETTEQKYYVDAIRLGLFSKTKIYDGKEVEKLDIAKQWSDLPPQSLVYKDIERFSWFSDHWLYVESDKPNIISDLRYSFLPHQITPLWGIQIAPSKPYEHTPFMTNRGLNNHDWRTYLKMLSGQNL